MQIWQAVVLGIVEGLTEFLPVSSTGHLILASWVLDIRGEAVKTFSIVIQGGALGAVLGLYRREVAAMCRGLVGRDPAGRRLATNLLVSFIPVGIAGFLLHPFIKRWLFSVWPVVAALGIGGVAMILFDRWMSFGGLLMRRCTLEELTPREALWIGLAQVLSLWPGTSRAMVTLMAGMGLGLSATAAAEYSFLLALPTLGAATLFDTARNIEGIFFELGPACVLAGFFASAIVAAFAVRGFLNYLTERKLAPFGWYRISLAIALGIAWGTTR